MSTEDRPANASDFHHLHGGGSIGPGDLQRYFSQPRPEPVPWKGETFELLDASGAVTEQARTPYQIWRKADAVGATRYIHVDLDGKRTLFEKQDGSWQPSTSPAPEPPRPAAPTRAQGKQDARSLQLEAGLAQRYTIGPAQVSMDEMSGQTEYRLRGDTSRVAFTESAMHVKTDTNSPTAVRSMVDVAEWRDWTPLRVTGHVDFKRMVWLEASVRGLQTLGYEPGRSDTEMLKREREERMVHRADAERGPRGGPADVATPGAKHSARGAGGRKAVLAAIESVLRARHVPEKQREAVMAAATKQLAQRARAGLVHRVRVYDKAAPSQRVVSRTPEVQPARERAAPVR